MSPVEFALTMRERLGERPGSECQLCYVDALKEIWQADAPHWGPSVQRMQTRLLNARLNAGEHTCREWGPDDRDI